MGLPFLKGNAKVTPCINTKLMRAHCSNKVNKKQRNNFFVIQNCPNFEAWKTYNFHSMTHIIYLNQSIEDLFNENLFGEWAEDYLQVAMEVSVVGFEKSAWDMAKECVVGLKTTKMPILQLKRRFLEIQKYDLWYTDSLGVCHTKFTSNESFLIKDLIFGSALTMFWQSVDEDKKMLLAEYPSLISEYVNDFNISIRTAAIIESIIRKEIPCDYNYYQSDGSVPQAPIAPPCPPAPDDASSPLEEENAALREQNETLKAEKIQLEEKIRNLEANAQAANSEMTEAEDGTSDYPQKIREKVLCNMLEGLGFDFEKRDMKARATQLLHALMPDISSKTCATFLTNRRVNVLHHQEKVDEMNKIIHSLGIDDCQIKRE